MIEHQSEYLYLLPDFLLTSLHSLFGGSSKVDVLICTPGRLIDHLNGTPNFTLQHLRFLVRSRFCTSWYTWLNFRRSLTKPTVYWRSHFKIGSRKCLLLLDFIKLKTIFSRQKPNLSPTRIQSPPVSFTDFHILNIQHF